MEKPKIPGMGSEEYSNGRIDKFSIEIDSMVNEAMINLFKELSFSDEVLNDLDMVYEEIFGYRFFYSENIKAHFFRDECGLTLIFDSNIEKEQLISIVEKYFQIF